MTVSEEILHAYLAVTQHASRQFRLHFGRVNLTFPQALVLDVLDEQSPLPISLLAERTGSANSTVSGIVDRLEKLGMVRRERGSRDHRVIYVALTEEYRQLSGRTNEKVRDYFARLMEKLDEGEQRATLEVLRRLDKLLREAEEEGR